MQTTPGFRAPLTPTQRDVYLDQQLHPGLAIYSVGSSITLGRELDRALWEEAVRAVFAAEPIMRSRIEVAADGLFQYVDGDATIELGYEQVAADDPDELHAW